MYTDDLLFFQTRVKLSLHEEGVVKFSVGYISEKLHFSLENSSCYESLFTEIALFLQRETSFLSISEF